MIRWPGSFCRLRPLALAMAFVVAFVAAVPPAPAADGRLYRASAQVADMAEELHRDVVGRLFQVTDKVVRGIVTHLNGSHGWALEIRSHFVDGRDRVFLNLRGTVPLGIPACPRALAGKVDGLRGYYLSTNGPVAVDFTIVSTERAGDDRWNVQVDLTVVIVVREFLRELVKGAGALLGTLAVTAAANHLIRVLEAANSRFLGEGLASGLKGFSALATGTINSGAYDAISHREAPGFLASLARNLNHRTVVYALGAGVIAVGLQSGMAVVGTSVGAVIGSMIAPGPGSAVGAAIGAVAASLVGNVVVEFATETIPMRFLLWRLRVYHESGADERKARLEERFVEDLRHDLDRDRTARLDKLTSFLESRHRDGESLEPYEVLIQGVLDLLRYSMVNEENWNGARKYYQLLGAIGRLPSQEGTEPK